MPRLRLILGSRSAITLVELLAVIVTICILALLLLPAVQMARESARAAACRNNLKQIGLGLLNYESAHRHFPKGAEGRFDRKLSPWSMYGMSWWADSLPYLELNDLSDRLDRTGVSTGWVQLNPHNGELVDGLALGFWFCPSSSIEHFVKAGGFRLAAPSYVGISGASSHNGFPETRVSPCCRSDGELSGGGTLVPNAFIRLRQVSDGLTGTLIVGEQSDFAYAGDGKPMRIDGGNPNGWITGTAALGIPPKYGSSSSPSYNLTTVRYALNERRYDIPGTYIDRGANNALLSPHPGIVHLLYCDGSVRSGADSMEVTVLKSLATRDENTNSIADLD